MRHCHKLVKSLLLFLLFLGIQPANARVITKKMDLKGGFLKLEANETLTIERGGRICNGTIVGNNSRIIVNTKKKWVLRNIELSGSWRGSISDQLFYYKERQRCHFQVVSSMFCFDTLRFSARRYYLEKWQMIKMKSGNVMIDGNGVLLFLTCNKGDITATEWGDRYKVYNLFHSDREEMSTLTIRNLYIADNKTTTDGWGEDVSVEKPVIYFCFCPGQTNLLFENVNSDGCGALLHTYTVDKNHGTMEFRNCHIKTSQFGIELGNRGNAHTNKVVITGCVFHRYKNCIFTGPLSIVGEANQVDTVIISNNTFYEPNGGNIEVSGAGYVCFRGNTTSNMFCYTGAVPPKQYDCIDNIIRLSSGETGTLGVSMQIAGEEIDIIGNSFEIIEKPFPFIEIRDPEKVKRMTVQRNTIIYSPKDNYEGFQCLFSFTVPYGSFEFYDNLFESAYSIPHFSNYFPHKMKRFEDAFMNKVDNHISN